MGVVKKSASGNNAINTGGTLDFQQLHTMFRLNAKVTLCTFNGVISSPSGCRTDENYWSLIGERGTVIETVNNNNRVLVLFEKPVSSRGLHCHNPIANSLYILETDWSSLRNGRGPTQLRRRVLGRATILWLFGVMNLTSEFKVSTQIHISRTKTKRSLCQGTK